MSSVSSTLLLFKEHISEYESDAQKFFYLYPDHKG